ncbi:MAG: SAM-dependent methyltransferase [Gemmatimonadota bacterium]
MTEEANRTRAPHRSRPLITLLQVLLYIPIQIFFIPFALMGLIVGVYKGMRRSKKLGVSFSAIQALQYRWLMHFFDTRPDPLSVAFIKKFPCESHFGLWSVFGALILSQRLFGFTTKLGKLPERGEETLASTPGHRLLEFDRILEESVDEVEQIVIPGVGFDLIALRFTEGRRVRVFELDQVGTLTVKTETLKRAGIKHDWVTYIPVDYSRESWVEKLLDAGFDRTKKTLFLWESVSLFLEADVVRDTLTQMAEMCATGSTIAQDFYSSAFASGGISRTVKKTSRVMERMGEPWRFGIDMGEDPRAAVKEFLTKCGLRVTEAYPFGEKLDVQPFYCIVESEKDVGSALEK